MIFPKAKKIARELHWHKTKDGVFGLYKGYFFNVVDGSLFSNPQYKLVSATTGTLTEEQKRQIKAALETNKKLLKFSVFEISDNNVLIQFFENLTFTKLKTVYALFDFLVDVFKKAGIAEQNKCHNCGTTENIKSYDLNDNGVLLCDPCYREIEKSHYDIEREKINEEKNYATGLLGSIVFSIPGIVAWILIAVYLERLASAMALVIAFLGLKGYDYFKGRHGMMTKYIIVICNIVSIVVANIATVIALLMNEGLTISEAFNELETNQAAKDIFNHNTLISFVLAFFIWIWLLFQLKDKKLAIRPAEKFVNSD